MESDANSKRKAKHTLSREETVRYLRRLADQLEEGAIQVSNEEMEFEGQVKVKESLKAKKGKTSVKVQFKLSTQEIHQEEAAGEGPAEAAPDEALVVSDGATAPAEAETDQSKPLSYKKLKKVMDKQFDAIGKRLEEGAALDPSEVKAFYDNCLLMTSFDKAKLGSAMYPEFEAKAQAFLEAGQGSDADALQQAYRDLKAMEKACHKKYD